MHKKVIVHPGCIEKDVAGGLLPADLDASARVALNEIQRVLDGAKNLIVTDDLELSRAQWGRLAQKHPDADVYLLRDDNTVYLGDCIEPGDTVELFGAYRGLCVQFAKTDAEKAGAMVTISETGTWDRPSLFELFD